MLISERHAQILSELQKNPNITVAQMAGHDTQVVPYKVFA